MSQSVSISEFLTALRQVISGQYSGRPMFFWPGRPAELRTTIDAAPEISAKTLWLDVNGLAEDIIPRLARKALQQKLETSVDGALASGLAVLVVENPYLLLRYESSAPLATFWNRFVDSAHAVVVVLPPPTRRPPELPEYVRFRGDELSQIFLDPAGIRVVMPNGGVEWS